MVKTLLQDTHSAFYLGTLQQLPIFSQLGMGFGVPLSYLLRLLLVCFTHEVRVPVSSYVHLCHDQSQYIPKFIHYFELLPSFLSLL